MRLKINLILWFLCSCGAQIFAQMDAYSYKREVQGISDTWHAVQIPDKMYSNVSSGLSDIRIYGITSSNDTIEAPYILKNNESKILDKQIDFEVINKSTSTNGSFVTYKVPIDQMINEIELFFDQNNFDTKLSLEGSEDLKTWYTIIDDYRVLSIKNELTSYDFTTIKFPNSKYQYYRVFIKENRNLDVTGAQINLKEVTVGDYKTYNNVAIQKSNQKVDKTTTIDVTLATAVPINTIKLKATNTFDYYRPFQISYLADSTKQENGWKYRYQRLTSGIITSIEENEFDFRNVIAKKIRITIENYDNEPLTIPTVEVKGASSELIVRFTTPATYYLTYGNKTVNRPSYDLKYITDKIPDNIKRLQLGEEKDIPKIPEEKVEPLFKNKVWLWAIMLIMIVLLGGFTLMMMKKK